MLTLHLLLFVSATFLSGICFLLVAVVLSGGVKQVTTLPEHITLKGTIIWPYIWDIYGIGYIIFHFLVTNIGCGIDKAILDVQ